MISVSPPGSSPSTYLPRRAVALGLAPPGSSGSIARRQSRAFKFLPASSLAPPFSMLRPSPARLWPPSLGPLLRRDRQRHTNSGGQQICGCNNIRLKKKYGQLALSGTTVDFSQPSFCLLASSPILGIATRMMRCPVAGETMMRLKADRIITQPERCVSPYDAYFFC